VSRDGGMKREGGLRVFVFEHSFGLHQRTKVHEFFRGATIEKKESSHPK